MIPNKLQFVTVNNSDQNNEENVLNNISGSNLVTAKFSQPRATPLQPSGCQPTNSEAVKQKWYGKRPLNLEKEGLDGCKGQKGTEG